MAGLRVAGLNGINFSEVLIYKEKVVAVLKAEKRAGSGKYVAFDLRKQGKIPAVVYGKKFENTNICIDQKSLQIVIATGERLIDLEIDGKKQMAVLKAVQHDNIGAGLVHADFRAIDENTLMHVDVEVELKGEAVGVDAGGVVEQDLHRVKIDCLPRNLPDKVVLDISALDLGKVLYVRDLPAVQGVTYRTHEDVAVVSCHKGVNKAEVAAPAAEAAAAPAAK